MRCPICMQENVSSVGDTHYICNNPDCIDDNGNRTQFHLVPDEYIRFPYNQIFVDRKTNEFYRQPKLELKNPGSTKIH